MSTEMKPYSRQIQRERPPRPRRLAAVWAVRHPCGSRVVRSAASVCLRRLRSPSPLGSEAERTAERGGRARQTWPDCGQSASQSDERTRSVPRQRCGCAHSRTHARGYGRALPLNTRSRAGLRTYTYTHAPFDVQRRDADIICAMRHNSPARDPISQVFPQCIQAGPRVAG